MTHPLVDPFSDAPATVNGSDLELTPAEEAKLADLTPRERARALGRIRKAREEAEVAKGAAPAKAASPVVPALEGTILGPGEMVNGKAQLLLIPTAQIDPDPDQPRKIFRNVGELAQNMKEVGLLQPITVRPGQGGRYILTYGERRLRAARQLNWTHIDTVVRYGIKDSSILVQQLTENSMREDLDPIEEARGIRAYMRQYRIATQLEAAIKLGHSLAWVSNRLALLDLDEEDQDAVARREMPILVAAKKARERVGNTRKKRVEQIAPHFGPDHDLVGLARSRCRAKAQIDGLSSHPPLTGSGACGSCWEDVIRQDATRRALAGKPKVAST